MAKDNTDKGNAYEAASRRLLENIAITLGIKELDPRQGNVPIIGLKTNNEWNADLIAYKLDGGKLKIECRYKGPKTSGIKGLEMAGISYEVSDCGVEGIVITNKPLQPKAENIAKTDQIGVIELQPGKSLDEYIAWVKNIFQHNLVCIGISECLSISDSLEVIVTNVKTGEVKRHT